MRRRYPNTTRRSHHKSPNDSIKPEYQIYGTKSYRVGKANALHPVGIGSLDQSPGHVFIQKAQSQALPPRAPIGFTVSRTHIFLRGYFQNARQRVQQIQYSFRYLEHDNGIRQR